MSKDKSKIVVHLKGLDIVKIQILKKELGLLSYREVVSRALDCLAEKHGLEEVVKLTKRDLKNQN